MPNPCILGRIMPLAAMDQAFTYSAPAINRLTFARAEFTCISPAPTGLSPSPDASGCRPAGKLRFEHRQSLHP